MSKGRWITIASFALLFAALVAVNVLASLAPLRLDVTQLKLFTLSEGTRRILAGLPEPVTVKLYVPDSVADAPVGVKTFARKVQELLREYEKASRGKLTLQVFDPKPDSEEEDWAARYGLTAARLPDGTQLFFGMVALSAGREAAVPFFDPRRERFLEYDISQAIARVNQKQRPRVQVLSWLPMIGQPGRGGMAEGEWYFLRELRNSYDIGYLFPQDKELKEIPDGTSLLIVVGPKNVPDSLSYAIDQYLVRGGKMIVLADPNARMDPAGGMAADISSLDKLFKAWGIETEGGKVVGDRTLATRVSAPNAGVVNFPLWISLTRRNLNPDLAITSELEEVTLIDAGSFRPAKDFKYTFTPLFTSSKESGLVELASARFLGPLEISRELKTDNQERVLAALVTGKFASAFSEGPPKEPPAEQGKGKEKKKGEKEEPSYKHPFQARGDQETSVLLVGDADFIADRFSVQVVNFFGNQVVQPVNDNLNFILNAVEFMTGSQDLIHIRSRGQLSRPFTRLQGLQAQAAAKYQQQEQLLSKRLEEVKKKLTELESQKQPGQKLTLSTAQLEEVNKFRREEARVRQQLREVRRVLRQDIDNLGNWLLAINLLAMPVVVAAAGSVVIVRRSRRR